MAEQQRLTVGGLATAGDDAMDSGRGHSLLAEKRKTIVGHHHGIEGIDT